MESGTGKYVLDEAGEAKRVDDLFEWAKWMDANYANRVIARDTLEAPGAKRTKSLPDEHADALAGKVEVSTVFLGLDHNWLMDGPPVLWETMVFGGDHDGYQERYTSREDAVKGHAEALRLARESLQRGQRCLSGF